MSGSVEYRTPPEFFEPLHREFGFNVDAAATVENALVRERTPLCSPLRCNMAHGRYYTAETDGTKREHYGPNDRVWANPPYSPHALVAAFIETAALTSREQGALWVLLLDVNIQSTKVYHNYVWDRELHRPRDRVEVRQPANRVPFIRPDGKRTAPPRPSILVVFRPPLEVLK